MRKGLVFVFLIFFFFPFPILAFWQSIVNAIAAIPLLIISFFILLFVILTGLIAFVCAKILDIVISPSFLSLGYTNPQTNPVIEAGLSITQSFVGLILVLILVYTALSIALRINEERAKKALVRVIIVALLVNFAPVFCGLVVDATNIIMNFFLRPIEDGVSGWFLQGVLPLVDAIKPRILGAATRITDATGILIMVFVQLVINISLAIAFLLYAIIFLLRYIAIWVLVILAPIAFCAWAIAPVGAPPEREIGFPLTTFVSSIAALIGNFWNTWLEQFIHWSVIGITLAFFLYLGVSNFYTLMEAFKTKSEMPGVEAATISYFNEAFPFLVIVALLYLGFIFGLRTAAIGTEGVIKGIQAVRARSFELTYRGIARTPREIVRAPMRMIAAYRSAVGRGQPRWRAIGAAIRVSPIVTAPRGVYSALRDIALTGLTAAEIIRRAPRERPTCPQCGGYIPSGARHCPHCGASMPSCPNCGHLAVAGERFCSHCGTRLG